MTATPETLITLAVLSFLAISKQNDYLEEFGIMATKTPVTVARGDGIGPAIMNPTLQVINFDGQPGYSLPGPVI